ncbi:bacteriophage alternative C-terminus of gp69 [Pseudomonas sp. StFLB209]|uniref:phage tail assembly protein T n=1 Tax=Pseudomonas sp. StFLB209 TaxID=1028989 RepID=UPI0004F876A8|nr:DUF4035 domain-containing protein [Pseudomonas sp. StFLB209]BAP44767.1 bacteriophage alternative C-terminus of gp69 [Pseudomonas sp. StFLB209]
MTLHDLRERLSAEELFLWKAYDRESPISDRRGDVQAAIVAAAAFQAQGAKVVAADLMPEWHVTIDMPGDTETDQGESAFKTFLKSASETS